MNSEFQWTDLDFFQSKTFRKILRVIRESNEQILPEQDRWFQAILETPFKEVKVVIIGQDPYPTEGHPNGLAFSVNPNIEPLPKSLVNIYRELKDDTGRSRTNGDLTDWARQGVLLLNTALTVCRGRPSSHSTIGWSKFVRDIISALNEHRDHIVFILWGRNAQTYGTFIDRSKHYIIKSAHPSPLSASRGFFGSKPFSKTNNYLRQHNIELIEW